MITEYMKTLDVQTCLDRWNEQVEAERRAEEAKARAEALRFAREEETRRRAEMAAQRAAEESRPAPQEDPAPQEAPDPRDFLYSPTFKMIDLTYDQAMALTNYFKENDLKFMSISKEKRRK
jgi:sRNA-binding protein